MRQYQDGILVESIQFSAEAQVDLIVGQKVEEWEAKRVKEEEELLEKYKLLEQELRREVREKQQQIEQLAATTAQEISTQREQLEIQRKQNEEAFSFRKNSSSDGSLPASLKRGVKEALCNEAAFYGLDLLKQALV
jgi:hypothetical protein